MTATVKTYAPESLFLQQLFGRLKESDVRYAVMRNHESLPFSSRGSDLDILVIPNHAEQIRLVVLETIRSIGGVPIGVAESVGFFKIYALGKTLNVTEQWWGLCLDFNAGLYFRGLQLLDEKVAWPLRYHHGIPLLEDGFAGVLGILKEVLNNEVFPDRYIKAAKMAAQSSWLEIELLLAPMGSEALTRLRTMLLSDSPAEKLQSECRLLRQEFMSHVFLQHAIKGRWARGAYEWHKVRRYLKPSGVVITILGVDGAGKSTVINAILPALNAATHNAVVVQHLRPTLLPPLARLKGKKHLPTGPVLEPHGSTPSGTVFSLLRLIYLTCDYLFGYWLWTRLKIAKQPTVVIFDRYAYDMVLDQRRFRIRLPQRVVEWFVAMAPKPDLIFCLHGNPEIIVARKGELPLEETKRQVNALREFARRESRAVLISTDTSIEETRDQVLQTLCTFLEKRAQERL